MSVIDELFNIFTHYALLGDPHDPAHLKSTHFQKFAKDCRMLTSQALHANLHILVKAHLAKQAKLMEGGNFGGSPVDSSQGGDSPRSRAKRRSVTESSAVSRKAITEQRAAAAAASAGASLTRLDFHGFLDLPMPIAPEVYPAPNAAPTSPSKKSGELDASALLSSLPSSSAPAPLAFQRLLMENVRWFDEWLLALRVPRV